jgi:hypothetical protein
VLAIKGSRFITHYLKLRDSARCRSTRAAGQHPTARGGRRPER